MPPAEVVELENSENSENEKAAPALQFSYVECLLFTLHQLGRKCPEFLSAPDNPQVLERVKDIKIRFVCLD